MCSLVFQGWLQDAWERISLAAIRTFRVIEMHGGRRCPAQMAELWLCLYSSYYYCRCLCLWAVWGPAFISALAPVSHLLSDCVNERLTAFPSHPSSHAGVVIAEWTSEHPAPTSPSNATSSLSCSAHPNCAGAAGGSRSD